MSKELREQFNKERLKEDSDEWTIEYILWLESKLKEANQQKRKDLDRNIKMRIEAITVLELVKGFTTNTEDEAMKSAIEMADYVIELTNT